MGGRAREAKWRVVAFHLAVVLLMQRLPPCLAGMAHAANPQCTSQFSDSESASRLGWRPTARAHLGLEYISPCCGLDHRSPACQWFAFFARHALPSVKRNDGCSMHFRKAVVT